MAVILETSLGDLTIDLYTDERPRCCLNFLKLCRIKYYNFSLFHSVQRNLVAQTGDPTGTGKGGESIFTKLYGDQARYFEQEVKPRIKHKKKGTVSMVNNGSDMHGSQFFITTGVDLDYLDGVHTVFGEISEGWEILDKINESIVDGENRPYRDIRIFHTVVLDDPYDDPADLAPHIPDRSPELTKEQLESSRIGVDEAIDDYEGKSLEERDEMLKEKEAKANAQLLELVGDLPDAEVRPEDNILFVCKLNPVTTSEDLEIIFSRFGQILSCEVIKDKKTGESLQYAFIEFQTNEMCENAYFKMDNVLIDDRRIHVDFSQSVAKMQGNEWKKNSKNDPDKETFRIKNTEWQRDKNYDLVFSSGDEAKSDKKKKKQKSKKHKRHDDSDSDRSKRKKTSRKEAGSRRERSQSPKRYEKRRERSRSPERYEKRRERSRSPKGYEKRRERSQSPKDRHKDYQRRSRDRDNFNKSYSKHKSRHRSRDRH